MSILEQFLCRVETIMEALERLGHQANPPTPSSPKPARQSLRRAYRAIHPDLRKRMHAPERDEAWPVRRD